MMMLMLPSKLYPIIICIFLYELVKHNIEAVNIAPRRLSARLQNYGKTKRNCARAFVITSFISPDTNGNELQERKSLSNTGIVANKRFGKLHGEKSNCSVALSNAMGKCGITISRIIGDTVQELGKRLIENKYYKHGTSLMMLMKQRLSTLSTIEQIALAIIGQCVYAFYLPGVHLIFPYQIIPTTSGFGVDIGIDSLVSLASSYLLWRSLQKPESHQLTLKPNDTVIIPIVATGLLASFYLSAYAARVVDNVLLLLSAMDWPVDPALQRSVTILLSHLTWVILGVKMLNYVVPLNQKKTLWYTLNSEELWVYKALMGYFVSCGVYNVADLIFNILQAFSKLIHPQLIIKEDITPEFVHVETSSMIPSIVTALGPCITAPWWEEMLYRVFVFKVINAKLPRNIATCIAALVFAVHHMNPHSIIQLFALGVLWSFIEQGTNNVFISMAIHSLWNTRIMLGTLMGK
ncbi:CAAX protease self-immunity family protein [Babesia bovis T2Bo]|uniref:CAAX prenyl protease 2/Lysostaphin resistance protein A-like domain-containing protein n=1 Tax=Babesia bovis TaxID=5865 RepID=A7AM57_BABBO|nr:CAAX protease self-immunity family protein [Babesia bovis T2Bo]EDO07641.1 CAAX protease self-immunity family protein [Babesia bovis T2Bo]|eukprot:XP_001611209.1 hypothetical protein [Babesia bovis T2Bo]